MSALVLARKVDYEVNVFFFYEAQKKVNISLEQLNKLRNAAPLALSEDLTLSKARAYFDIVLEASFMFIDKFNSNAKIVSNPQFKAGILKIQNKQADALSETENFLFQ